MKEDKKMRKSGGNIGNRPGKQESTRLTDNKRKNYTSISCGYLMRTRLAVMVKRFLRFL